MESINHHRGRAAPFEATGEKMKIDFFSVFSGTFRTLQKTRIDKRRAAFCHKLIQLKQSTE